MYMDSYGFESFMFSLVPVIIMIGFVVIFGLIIISAIRGTIEWNNNNNSPVLTVDATVVTKRIAVNEHIHHHDTDVGIHHTSNSTTYYATFEVESGDRIEFHIPDSEFELLVEGDNGKLTFQGTRYKTFERIK